MNNKKVITSIGVLFLSAIAATSGTFAWFITSREALIQYSGASVYTSGSDLTITYKSSLNTIDAVNDVEYVTASNAMNITNSQTVTDISGDGIDFNKVVWSSDENIASSIYNIETEDVGDADGYFVDFTVTVSRPSEADRFKVFLGDGTAILPLDSGSDEDKGIVKALRMVVINYDDNDSATGNPSVIIRHGTNAQSPARYLKKEADGTAYSSGTHSFEADSLYDSAPFTTESIIADAEDNYPAIADLTTDASVDITFRFYIEGEDGDTINDYIHGTFSVELNLYALYA